VVLITWFLPLRLAASCRVFGLASISAFGVASNSEFVVASDSRFVVASDSGFGVASDSGFGVASDSGFGEDLTNDSDMGELFPDVSFLNEWSSDELLQNTDVFLEPTNALPGQDTHVECTQAITDTNPDENLFFYLMDSTNTGDINGNQDQTFNQECLSMADASGNIPVILVENTADSMFLNDGWAVNENFDISPEQNSHMEMQENEAVSNMKRADNRHRKGPRPLSKDQFKDEKMFKNAKRCRDYRTNKKSTVEVEMTELEKLEVKNTNLKNREDNLKESVTKIKKLYVKMISEGRIKFC